MHTRNERLGGGSLLRKYSDLYGQNTRNATMNKIQIVLPSRLLVWGKVGWEVFWVSFCLRNVW